MGTHLDPQLDSAFGVPVKGPKSCTECTAKALENVTKLFTIAYTHITYNLDVASVNAVAVTSGKAKESFDSLPQSLLCECYIYTQ